MFLLKAGGEKRESHLSCFQTTHGVLSRQRGWAKHSGLDASANDDDCEAPLEQLKGGRSFKTHC